MTEVSDTTTDYGRSRAAEVVARGEGDPDLIPCPECAGRGGGQAIVCGPNVHGLRYMKCSFCKGGGKVWSYNGIQYRMSRLLSEARRAKDYTTREISKLYGCTMSEWSNLEHGRKSIVEIDDATKWLATQPARQR